MNAMLDDLAIASLARIVGAENVLADADSLDRYTGDSLSPSRAFEAADAFERLADVVVRPGCAAEVSQVVVWANERRVPIVPYGGGTGVMGAVVPGTGRPRARRQTHEWRPRRGRRQPDGPGRSGDRSGRPRGHPGRAWPYDRPRPVQRAHRHHRRYHIYQWSGVPRLRPWPDGRPGGGTGGRASRRADYRDARHSQVFLRAPT